MSRVRTLEHIAEDRRHPGVRRPIRHELPAEALGPMATSTASVPPDGDVVLDATVEATGLDVVLSGTVTFPWEGDCRRCLEPVAGTIEADLHEIFTTDPVEGETWGFVGDAIDLAPVLHDAVLLSLPLVPLCSDDCRGPDPDRFPATVEATGARDDAVPGADDGGGTDEAVGDQAADDDRPRDPRWAALDALTFDD